VLKVLVLLKGKLPEAASSKRNAALGGALDQAEAAPESAAEAVQEGGIPADKAPAALTAILDQLKGHLPESMSGDIQKALGGGGGGPGALPGKVAGMLGVKLSPFCSASSARWSAVTSAGTCWGWRTSQELTCAAWGSPWAVLVLFVYGLLKRAKSIGEGQRDEPPATARGGGPELAPGLLLREAGAAAPAFWGVLLGLVVAIGPWTAKYEEVLHVRRHDGLDP
jgi:hypothetical protein